MMITRIILRLKNQPSIPVEAENIHPEILRGKSLEEICSLELWCGNRRQQLGDYFEVEITERGEAGYPTKVDIYGDLSRFQRLGQGMSSGIMEIHGSVGFHAGAMMRGGSLRIAGNSGDWLGAHMEGGQIMVEGSAGHFTGSAYRGKTQGMSGGTILILNNAGQMTGSRMRRGLIAVGGDCGDATGFKLRGGTILAAGACGIRTGADMRRGTVILFRETELLPTFYYNCHYRPTFWGLLVKELQKQGFKLSKFSQDVSFKRFSGDAHEGGKGEILICQSH